MTPLFAAALILVVTFAGWYLIGQWVTWSAQSKPERRLRAGVGGVMPYGLYAGIMAILLSGATVLLVLAWRQWRADRLTPGERRLRDLPRLSDDWEGGKP